jgi:hypothetical protein
VLAQLARVREGGVNELCALELGGLLHLDERFFALGRDSRHLTQLTFEAVELAEKRIDHIWQAPVGCCHFERREPSCDLLNAECDVRLRAARGALCLQHTLLPEPQRSHLALEAIVRRCQLRMFAREHLVLPAHAAHFGPALNEQTRRLLHPCHHRRGACLCRRRTADLRRSELPQLRCVRTLGQLCHRVLDGLCENSYLRLRLLKLLPARASLRLPRPYASMRR